MAAASHTGRSTTMSMSPPLTLDVESDVIQGYHRTNALLWTLSPVFPFPWSPGAGPRIVPPGFLKERAGGP
jgi:hypothetical protein